MPFGVGFAAHVGGAEPSCERGRLIAGARPTSAIARLVVAAIAALSGRNRSPEHQLVLGLELLASKAATCSVPW